ncbi:MAG: YcxB family protein [Eubacteriales bacterium]
MESLFENQTIYTRKLFMETQNAAYSKFHKTFRMFLLILSVIFMITALICLGIYLANKDVKILVGGAGLFVLSVAFLILHFHVYKFRANGEFKTNLAMCPSGEHSYSVFSDNIQLTTSQSNQTIPLDQVTRIFETENTFCIMVQKKFLFFTKNGFTKGTASEFREFLKQTCPKKYM